MKLKDLPKKNPRGRVNEVENGVIKSVSLSVADHGFLTAWLHLEFGCGGCGFGGYCLGKADQKRFSKDGGDYASYFVVRCLNVVGVEKWEDLEGRPLRVLSEGLGGGIVAIGNFLKDEWFCPSIEFERESESMDQVADMVEACGKNG